MSSNINVSLDNPYGEVTIPRAKLRPSDDISTVIANPMALSGNNENPYAVSSSAPPPYMVKEDGGGEEEGGRCRACCYRCRRK
uniref:Si:ch211-202f5.3 n=1 Tax=Stegastes partitus TaxID=144197 RepID=A0A3B5A354_9TELE